MSCIDQLHLVILGGDLVTWFVVWRFFWHFVTSALSCQSHLHDPSSQSRRQNFAVHIQESSLTMLNITDLTLANAAAFIENLDFEVLKDQVEQRLQTISPETALVYLYFVWCIWRIVRSLLTFSTVFVVVSSVMIYVTTMQEKSQWKFVALIACGVVSANGVCGKKTTVYYIIPHLGLDVLALIHFGFMRRGLLAFGLGVVGGFYVLPWARVVDRLFQWSVWLAIIVAVAVLATLGGLGATVVKDEL